MKKRSSLSGVVRQCTREVNGERCTSTVTKAQAHQTLARQGEVLCIAHAHALEAPRIQSEENALGLEYHRRVAARRQAEVGLP
jgi:hypothetical protein